MRYMRARHILSRHLASRHEGARDNYAIRPKKGSIARAIYIYIYVYICDNVYIYIYISADLFQSESVLDYIVISLYLPVLQNPIGHYCKTLQSHILKIAIYHTAECTLPYCIILKGYDKSATARHRAPQAGKLSGPHKPKYLRILLKSLKIQGNHLQ